MMALPSSLNPILRIHLPIVLSLPETATASTTPGAIATRSGFHDMSPVQASIEALRLSLLGVASVHQSYMLAKSGVENREPAGNMWELASRLRTLASRWLGIASESLEGCRSDAALGACVSIALIDVRQTHLGLKRAIICANDYNLSLIGRFSLEDITMPQIWRLG